MTNLEMNQNISDFIGNYCTKWNISVSKFAEKCDVPYMTIKRIMACSVQKIDVYTIARISEATRTPLMEIIGMNRDNLELYKHISYASAYNKRAITYLMHILEQLHISGTECREIPYAPLKASGNTYLINYHFFENEQISFSRMEKITFRSSFSEGYVYFGLQIPDNRLHPFFHKDNILLVKNEEPCEGEIGVFARKTEGNICIILRKVHWKGRYMELLPITGRGKKYCIDTENVSELISWITLGVSVGIIR